MKIAELVPAVKQEQADFVKTKLGDITFENRQIKTNGTSVHLDDDALSVFGQYLTIPGKFLTKLPEDLTDATVKHFLQKWEGAETILELRGGELVGVYKGDEKLIPKLRLAETIAKVMPKGSEVVRFDMHGPRFHAAVVTDTLQTEAKVGDVTRGGIRVVGHIQTGPYVSSYLERLVCTNGMVVPEEFGKISLRGNTVDEVIEEMEQAAQKILTEQIGQRLEQWNHLTQVHVDNAEQLIHRLARESGLSAGVQDRIIERVPDLEGDTAYDVVNLITSMQHEEGITSRQVRRLMFLGGRAIENGLGHRCGSCQHRLD